MFHQPTGVLSAAFIHMCLHKSVYTTDPDILINNHRFREYYCRIRHNTWREVDILKFCLISRYFGRSYRLLYQIFVLIRWSLQFAKYLQYQRSKLFWTTTKQYVGSSLLMQVFWNVCIIGTLFPRNSGLNKGWKTGNQLLNYRGLLLNVPNSG